MERKAMPSYGTENQRSEQERERERERDESSDYMNNCECSEIMKDLSLSELNHADRVIVRMLHKKCAVIARARSEMNQLDDKFNNHIEELKRREVIAKKLWRKKFGVIMIAGVLITAWFFIMYGVILGSLLCSKLPSNCRILDSIVLRLPGLYWHNSNQHRVF